MRLRRSVVLLLSESAAAVFLVGCQPPVKPPPRPAPPTVSSEEQASQVQVDIKHYAPDAHIGRVGKIDASEQLAAVNGLTEKDVKKGDIVSILDGSQKVVANGTVDSIYTAPTGVQSVVVQYDISPDGGRAPIVGDLVVTQLTANNRPA